MYRFLIFACPGFTKNATCMYLIHIQYIKFVLNYYKVLISETLNLLLFKCKIDKHLITIYQILNDNVADDFISTNIFIYFICFTPTSTEQRPVHLISTSVGSCLRPVTYESV